MGAGRFDDPTALALLRDDERARAERARAEAPPAGWAQRLDAALLTRQAQAMTVRTVAVDDAVRAGGNPQLVVLGAGLDGRAWRMPELAGVDVFEVDHPASQEDKRRRAHGLRPTARSLRFVPADLTDAAALGPALAAAGHREDRPTTWALEGVLPYLTGDDAAATVAAVAARSAPGSRLVVSYQAGSLTAALGRLLARTFLALTRRGDPMANEPRRSSWTQASVRALLTGAGLRVVDDIALPAVAADLAVPAGHVRTSRVAVAITAATPPGS
jgi:methyltransferase (TIGR00027 family)